MDPVSIAEPHPSSSCSNYAFITHSQDALPLNLPPSIDDVPLVRRRRRRTSPHDQAILEQEYRKCIKPDKARRREICKLVQMGEKEVQIWFCNKRQAQRRRATPLQPHEMVPNSSRSMSRVASSSQLSLASSSPGGVGLRRTVSDISVLSGFPISSSPSTLVSVPTIRPARGLHYYHNSQHYDGQEPREPRDEFLSEQHLEEGEEHDNDDDDDDDDEQEEERDRRLDAELLSREPESQQTHIHTFTQEDTVMSSAAVTATVASTAPQEAKMTTSTHRRLQDVLNGSVVPEKPRLPLPPIPSPLNPRRTPAVNSNAMPRLLRRSSSAIRLTTSLEGKATVILECEPASSPPKPPPTPAARTTRRRPLSTPVDSKLWEFCCDNQSAIQSPAWTPPQPTEATQALRLLRTRRHTINNGSAPTLLRTLSQSQATATNQQLQFSKPTLGKQLQPYPPSSSKRTPAKKKDRKIITSTKKALRPKPLCGSSNNRDFSVFEASMDSDKENRPPGAPVSPPPEPKHRALGVPGKGGISLISKKDKGKAVVRKRLEERRPNRNDYDEGYGASQETVGGEDASQETDLFAASQDSGIAGGSRDSPRRLDELECVENLLSLRGGTWR